MPPVSHWSVELHVRADAESMFVPVALLPEAQPDDIVELVPPDGGAPRRGTVTDHVDDHTRGSFLVVHLDESD